MEPDRKKVDTFFTSRLEGLKTEPSGKVWQGIESRYFRKGAFLRLWGILPMLLLIGSGIAMYTVFFSTDDAAPLPDESTREEAAVAPPGNQPEKVVPTINENEAWPDSPVLKTEDPSQGHSTGLTRQYHEPVGTIRPVMAKNIYASDPLFPSDAIADETRETSEPALGYALKDDYIRKDEFWLGAQVTPSVVFYPGKNNKNSWSGELTFDYVPSRFTFQAGLGLGYYKEPGEYQVSYSSYDSVGFYYDVSSFALHPDNPDSVMFELSETSIFDTVDHIVLDEIQNKYLYLRLPVKIGYNIFNTKRLSFHIRGGVVFSLLIWKDEPEVRIPADDISLINIEQTYPGRLQTSWQFTAGISVIYNLSKRVGISFEPTYLHYIGSLYKPGFDYSNTRPYAFGLRTGIYVKF